MLENGAKSMRNRNLKSYDNFISSIDSQPLEVKSIKSLTSSQV